VDDIARELKTFEFWLKQMDPQKIREIVSKIDSLPIRITHESSTHIRNPLIEIMSSNGHQHTTTQNLIIEGFNKLAKQLYYQQTQASSERASLKEEITNLSQKLDYVMRKQSEIKQELSEINKDLGWIEVPGTKEK
jgi:seryl-tRNA synthetase